MKTNNYNLQLLHHEEVFVTRELALKYLTDFYKPYSLDAEPVIVKYGDISDPDIILAFGTSDAAPGSFYAIDMTKANEQIENLVEKSEQDKEELDNIAQRLNEVVAAAGFDVDENKITNKITYKPDANDDVIGTAVTIAEAVDLLSKYAQNGFADNELSVEDTKSVRLIYSVNPNGGKTLKAEINVSTNGDSDELGFNNNIIGIKSDGVYAAAHLSYDDVRHELIFTTSGYKNGRFQDDAIVQRVNLGEHTKLVADNENHTVRLTISENESNYTTTLSADVQISSNEDNILEVKDNKLAVIGRAKNIKYGDSNVAVALNNHKDKLNQLETRVENSSKSAHIEGGQTDTLQTVVDTLFDGGAKVTGNVRLGSGNSIVVRNGGLEANITVDVDTASNKLIVTIGNQTIEKTLPGVELFQSAEYNDENEELIITFKTGNTLVIPIHGIIHTWETKNAQNSPITLTKTIVTGGVDTLSGDLKLRSTDNILGIENGNLYASENLINTKIASETTRATNAETTLQNNISALETNVNSRLESISEEISDVRDSIVTEKERAIESENAIKNTAEHADEIAQEAKRLASEANATVAAVSEALTETDTKLASLTTTVNENKADANSKFAETNTNVAANTSAINNLTSDLATERTERTNADTEIRGIIDTVRDSVTAETQRAGAAEVALGERITTLSDKEAHDIEDVRDLIENETARATNAENTNAVRIEEIDNLVNTKANSSDVYTKTEIDNKGYLTEHQDISGLENSITELNTTVNDIKFITRESDTVNVTMDKQTGDEYRTLSAEVKLKTITGSENANIIKKDANGLYATVTFNYDKISNTITFNDGNGDKTFELNNFGILQDAFYESATKSIVLIIKKDDETTERITIPVADLVNTWTVENKATSPVVLEKTIGENGDILSADVSILNDSHNLLVKQNGSLFADADSNKHIALWGTDKTTVQGVINILKERTDEIDGIKQDIVDLETDTQSIKTAIATYQTDLNNQKDRITRNENDIDDLQERQTQLEVDFARLSLKVDTFDSKVAEALEKATEAEAIVNQLKEKLGDIQSSENTVAERLDRIEDVISSLIDFGEYNTGN